MHNRIGSVFSAIKRLAKWLSSMSLISQFWTPSGVRCSCIFPPTLFFITIDWIPDHMYKKSWDNVSGFWYNDLVSADVTVLVSDAAVCLSSFSSSASTLSLCKELYKVKSCIAVNGTPYPSHSYGVSLAIWDHTVLPATRHERTHPCVSHGRRLKLWDTAISYDSRW